MKVMVDLMDCRLNVNVLCGQERWATYCNWRPAFDHSPFQESWEKSPNSGQYLSQWLGGEYRDVGRDGVEARDQERLLIVVHKYNVLIIEVV